MTRWLTELPWGWYAGLLTLVGVLLYAAGAYMDIKDECEYRRRGADPPAPAPVDACDPYIAAQMIEHTDVVLTSEGATLAYQLEQYLAGREREAS